MKILCIGHSFSVDVSTYVHQIAESVGKDIDIYVLYIGGCPIDKHYHLMQTGDQAYEFYKNGNNTPIMWCSLLEGLKYDKWDYITFQQVSGKSCDADSFFPELPLLMEEVRKYTDAKFLLHMTWSYAKDFSHEKYGSHPMDQEAMTNDIFKAYDIVSKKVNIPYVIPSGRAVKYAREIYGDVLNRDGYHLSELGRTLTGYVWAYYFLGLDIDVSSFRPQGYSYDEVTGPVEDKVLETLRDIAKKAIVDNKGFNLND